MVTQQAHNLPVAGSIPAAAIESETGHISDSRIHVARLGLMWRWS